MIICVSDLLSFCEMCRKLSTGYAQRCGKRRNLAVSALPGDAFATLLDAANVGKLCGAFPFARCVSTVPSRSGLFLFPENANDGGELLGARPVVVLVGYDGRRVAKEAGNVGKVDTSGMEHGCVRVAQVLPRNVGERLSHMPTPVRVAHALGVGRSSVPVVAHVRVSQRFQEQAAQAVGVRRGDGNVALAPLRLGGDDLDLAAQELDPAPYADDGAPALQELNVLPADPERLGAAHPAERRQDVRALPRLALGGLKYRPQLLLGVDRRVHLARGPLRVGHGVALAHHAVVGQLLVLRERVHRAQDGEAALRRTVAHAVEPFLHVALREPLQVPRSERGGDVGVVRADVPPHGRLGEPLYMLEVARLPEHGHCHARACLALVVEHPELREAGGRLGLGAVQRLEALAALARVWVGRQGLADLVHARLVPFDAAP